MLAVIAGRGVVCGLPLVADENMLPGILAIVRTLADLEGGPGQNIFDKHQVGRMIILSKYS